MKDVIAQVLLKNSLQLRNKNYFCYSDRLTLPYPKIYKAVSLVLYIIAVYIPLKVKLRAARNSKTTSSVETWHDVSNLLFSKLSFPPDVMNCWRSILGKHSPSYIDFLRGMLKVMMERKHILYIII